jgi:hypothetical protein
MRNGSRGLREAVIHALAMVGLVWAVAVLGALFMAMGSHGQDADGGYSLAAGAATAHHGLAFASGEAPRTAGMALALVVLGCGAAVLLIGAISTEREPEPLDDAPLRDPLLHPLLDPQLDPLLDPAPDAGVPADPADELSLALGLGLLV